MKLFSKLKNILFDEEEVEIPVIEKEEKKCVVIPKEESKEVKKEEYSTREILKSEPKKSNIEALLDNKPREKEEYVEPKTRSLNILDYEKRQKKEKPTLFGSKEEHPKKTFKPSPVISPIYGVIDVDYEPISVTSSPVIKSSNKIDIDEVRNKAFGTLEDEIINTLDRPIEDFYKEDSPKTIDELLGDDLEEIEDNTTEDINNESLNKLDVLEEIEANLNQKTKEEIKEEKPKINMDDTIESDLFKLIDSMYENREEGD